MSSLRRGHANLLCIVPIFTDDAEAFRTGIEPPPLPTPGGFPASLWWRAQARLEKLLGGSEEHHRAGHWLKFSTSNQMASVYTSRAHLLPPVQERPPECDRPYPTGGSAALQPKREGTTGIEPVTIGSAIQCSTAELCTRCCWANPPNARQP